MQKTYTITQILNRALIQTFENNKFIKEYNIISEDLELYVDLLEFNGYKQDDIDEVLECYHA